MKSYAKLIAAGVALLAALPFSTAANAADDNGESQVPEFGGVFNMPAGNHFDASALAGKIVDLPLMVEGGDASYRAMKDRAARVMGRAESARGRASESAETRGIIAPVCTTNAATGFFPPDIHGAVGSTNMVVVTNVNIGVFNRSTCGTVSNVSLTSFFTTGSFAPTGTETLFDPRVIRDKHTGRFFVSAESRDSAFVNDQYQYFAVSLNGLGTSWARYRIVLSRASTNTVFCKKAANSFWDYPSNGVSNRRWFITSNDFGPSSDTSAALTINKGPTLTGSSTSVRCYRALSTFIDLAPPIVRDTSRRSTFLNARSNGGTVVRRLDYQEGSAHADDRMHSRPSYNVTNWSVAPDAKQPNLQELDTLDGRFQSASIQGGGQIWNVHAVNVGGIPAARVYRFGNSSAGSSPVLNAKTLPCVQSPCEHQFNTSLSTNFNAGAPLFVNLSRTNPSAAIANGLGRASFIMMRSKNNNFSSWTSNRLAVSPSQFERESSQTFGDTTCNAAAKGACRWGDYSSAQPDPQNINTAFGWNQLIEPPIEGSNYSSNWSTRGGHAN